MGCQGAEGQKPSSWEEPRDCHVQSSHYDCVYTAAQTLAVSQSWPFRCSVSLDLLEEAAAPSSPGILCLESRVQEALTGVPRSCPEMKAGCSLGFTLFNQLQWRRQINSFLHMNSNSFKWQKRTQQPENVRTELQPVLSSFCLNWVHSSAQVTVLQP